MSWYGDAWDYTKGAADSLSLGVGGEDLMDDISGAKTAREMGAAQEQALDKARDAQEEGYQRSKEQLSPYAETGGQFLEGLSGGVQSGAFDPGAFHYGGEQTGQFNYQGPGQQGGSGYAGDPNITFGYQGQQQGASDYQGQQQGNFNYNNGQQSQNAYRGGPEMGSIQSFMGDPSQTPGYQFQLEQGQKAIDRAAAAGGRFGGGQTAKELLRQSQGMASQAYGDEFNRASQEREAQRFGEQSQYGRGQDVMQSRNRAEDIGYGRDLNAFNLGNQAEQSNYGRSLNALGLANQAEQSAYGRAENQAGINRQIEADQYNRSETGLNRANLAEQSAYDRELQRHGLQTGREQQVFDRQRQGYGDQVSRLQDDFNRQVGMTNMGMDASTMMSNAALGQGSALSNLAIQQGNANAAQIAGEGTTAGNLLNLAGQGAQIYGAFGGAG